MTLLWLTPPGETKDLVTYRSDDDDTWHEQQGIHKNLPEDAKYVLHTAELTGLQPDKTYLFRIGSQEKIYKFHTIPATLTKPLKFVAGGDMYHDDIPTLRETNRQAALTGPSFALVGGDIAYAAGWGTGYFPKWASKMINKHRTQEFGKWLEWLKAWTEDMVTPEGYLIPMLPILGNHDVVGGFDETPEQAPFFYALFPMPGSQGYNVVDFGDWMSIMLLDSGHTHPIEGKQTEWLDEKLKARQNVPFKCAVYHVPAFPSYRNFDYRYSAEVRKNWVPLFDKYHLNMAFEHHDHAYKRTYPILNGVIDPAGVVYVGDGAWGVKKPRKPRSESKRWYLEKTAQARHFILVEHDMSNTKVSAITGEGIVIDER
jgi:hypothetical protein